MVFKRSRLRCHGPDPVLAARRALTRAQWAPVDLTLTRSTVETSRPAAGEGRARARRRSIVETSTPAAGDRSVYPVGRSPGQGAGYGGRRGDL